MMPSRTRLPALLLACVALSGCAGSSAERAPGEPFAIPVNPVSDTGIPIESLQRAGESYVIQRAPVRALPPARVFPAPAARIVRVPDAAPVLERAVTVPVERSDAYERTDLFEIETRPPVRRVIGSRRIGDRPARYEGERTARYEGGFAPFEGGPGGDSAPSERNDFAERGARLAAERAAARDARLAAADTDRAAAENEVALEARRAAEREALRTARANPVVPRRPTALGRFVTRAAEALSPAPSPTPEPVAVPAIAAERVAAVTPRVLPPAPSPAAPVRAPAPAVAPPEPRPVVARAPIPGLKPYLLARSPSPSAKPRRTPPAAPEPREREFGVVAAALLPGTLPAATPPSSVTIPTEPGADLGARFFPTPGKPSVRGTDQDRALDLASIDAVNYGIGGGVSAAIVGEDDTAEWGDAVRLIEAGEVAALAIQADSDFVLTLCSGRDITTTPPDLAAAATLTAPQIICGLNKPLELR